MMRAVSRIIVLVALIVVPGLVFGQSTFGTIEGRVLDATGAALPGATVTVVYVKTAVQRSTVTNEQGLYRALNLNPGEHDLTVELQGFKTVLYKKVQVENGQTVTINVKMEVAGVSETMTVMGSSPLVNAATAEMSNTIGTRQVNETPLNGREFTRLSLFAPGVVQSSASVASIVINGNSASQSNYLLDGVDATRVDASYQANGFERGAKLQTASVESIEEFRVLTANYSAEYGRATGGVITAITKSGGNTFKGSAFAFYRNDVFDARNYFDPPQKPPFDLKQFGGSLGGPVKRDSIFFFSSYEGSRKDLGATASGTVPSTAFRATVASALAPILASIPLPTQATSNPNVGQVTYADNVHVKENIFSARMDAKLSNKDSLYARYNIQDSLVDGPLYTVYTTSLSGQRQYVPQRVQSFTTSYSRFLRSNMMNEAKFGLNQFASDMQYLDPNSPVAVPRTTITGVTVTPGVPQGESQRSTSLEFIDNFTWYKGSHNLKAGINIRRVMHNYNNVSNETLTFASLADFAANRPSQASYNPAIPLTKIRNWNEAYYIQDDYKATRRLTINAGLRYDYGTPHTDVDGRLLNFDVTTMQMASPGSTPYNPDRNDFAPRIGLTFDLLGNGRTILRGGYGMFYMMYAAGSAGFLVIANAPGATLLTRTQTPNLAYPVTSFSGGYSNPPTKRALDPDRRDNYAHQMTVNLQQQIGTDMALTVAYVANWNRNNSRTRPLNLIDPATAKRPDTRYSQILWEESSGQSDFKSFQAALNRRLSRGLAFNVSYTYSTLWDDIVSPQNPFASWDLEWARSSSNVPHSLAASFQYELPFGPGKPWANGGGVATTLLGGWQLNSVLLTRSGTPYTVTLGSVTRSGTGWTTNQRPNEVAGVSHEGTIDQATGWLNLAAFRDPATGTFGTLGRNTERGPMFLQLDTSLIKNTSLGGSRNLQFRLEVFNVLNRLQLPAAPNANFLAPTSFGNFYNTFGRTEGFGTARQLQFALRFSF